MNKSDGLALTATLSTTEPILGVDVDEAQRFFAAVAPDELLTFQTFDDTARKNPALAKVMHGSLEDCSDALSELNARGSGVFCTVNRTDGRGRKAENVTGVRCVFLDLDGAPLEPVLHAGVEPHAVVESSPGKWHVYWKVTDCSKDQFKPAQKALAAKFGGDRSVNDLPRVMRVPGFLHCKGTPFRTRIVSLGAQQPYAFDDLILRLGVDLAGAVPRTKPTRVAPNRSTTGKIGQGGRRTHVVQHGGQMNWRGMTPEGVHAELLAVNQRDCEPPLPEAEVEAIAADIVTRYAGQHGRDHRPIHATGIDAGALPEWVEKLGNWGHSTNFANRKVAVEFAVHGWIPAGKVGALVAAGGTGKTTLLLILAVCIALGRPFFGCQVLQGAFVLLSGDDSQDDLDGALVLVMQAMKLTPNDVAQVAERVRILSLLQLDGVRTFTTTVHGDVVATGLENLIAHAVQGVKNLRGIALDTLRQFSGGSSNDEQVIKLTIAGATKLALETGAFVILPHHTGKQNFREGVTDMYAGSGSAAIADNCRFVLLLQTTTWADIASKVNRTGQERGDPLVLRSTRGSLLVKAPEPMFLYRDGYHMGRVAGSVLTREQQGDERDREILRAVGGSAETKTAIAKKVRGRRTDVLARIAELEGQGYLFRPASSSGKYKLTANGATLVGGVP